jgi:hypothetical protein
MFDYRPSAKFQYDHTREEPSQFLLQKYLHIELGDLKTVQVLALDL